MNNEHLPTLLRELADKAEKQNDDIIKGLQAYDVLIKAKEMQLIEHKIEIQRLQERLHSYKSVNEELIRVNRSQWNQLEAKDKIIHELTKQIEERDILDEELIVFTRKSR